MYLFSSILLACYILATLVLIIYGYNCYYFLYLFFKNKKRKSIEHHAFIQSFYEGFDQRDYPCVTTQLPIYNERFVVERLIESVIAIDYPKEKHEIQVLDDSDDETVELVQTLVSKYQAKGYRIHHIRRPERKEFKAGALQYGMEMSESAYLSVFDSDFTPPSDFYRQTIPYFCKDEGLGMVQTRWGHLNAKRSWLTRAQSIGIDGHFVIEQTARCWGGYFINFNGTAGVWKREAIEEAGGWQGDTLTEDMDLSYRSQLAGWGTHFLYDVVCKAEIPENMNAFKSQQFRWAKGSIQTAKKLLGAVYRAPLPLGHKFQSTLHMTHYIIHPFMLLMAICALPILYFVNMDMPSWIFIMIMVILTGTLSAPSGMYIVSQWAQKGDWYKKLFNVPILVCIGVGIAVNNAHAVFSAIFGSKGVFVRTPKSGATSDSKGEVGKIRYKVKLKKAYFIELFLAVYCFYSFIIYVQAGKYLVGPFSLIYAIGFSLASILSLQHYFFKQRNL